MKKTTEITTVHDPVGQAGFPDFLQDTKIVKQQQAQAQAEIIDIGKLSSQLDKTTGFIRKEVGNVAKSFCRIGFKLWEVREQKQYLGQEYKNVYEYAENALGFKKASTANYISVCERFSVQKDNKPTSQLLPNFANFSYTQLSEMLPLSDEKITEITPETTCKDIRRIKKAAKGNLESGGEQEQGEQAELEDGKGKQDEKGLFVAIDDLIFNQEFTGVNADVIHAAMFKYIGYEIKVYVKVGKFLYGEDKEASKTE